MEQATNFVDEHDKQLDEKKKVNLYAKEIHQDSQTHNPSKNGFLYFAFGPNLKG